MEKISLIQLLLVLLIIIAEAIFSIRHDLHEYKIKDTLANISIAAANALISLFVRGFTLRALIAFQKISLLDFGHSCTTWVILFLLTDLTHFGFHYLEHKTRFLWAAHSVHHSSSSYNFSTAVRTAQTNNLYKFIYEIPLCLVGFDAFMVVFIHSLIHLFTFFQHTEHIKKMGWLEQFLNTPSHHRVHHASDEKYLDKNFGGVLIIWDKLFGTFQCEEEKPRYGLTKAIATYDPVKIVLHEWKAIGRDVYRSDSWIQALSYIFRKPGWRPGATDKTAHSTRGNKPCKKGGQCSGKCIERFAIT
jgi:sterol desaturase/sphingolipid hydroxylase (fatty acid hydroxylase superfamily)